MKTIIEDPWHDGERAVQQRMGVRERLHEIGPRLMRSFLTDEHRAFFPQLDFVVVGVVDDDGAPRATLVDGGAVSPTPTTLSLSMPSLADPAAAGLAVGAPIAVLGLQPQTRRRNRANGVVASVDDGVVTVEVRQTFGNCPKFIRARAAKTQPTSTAPRMTKASSLSPGDVGWIRSADTFFIASAHAAAGDDVAAHGVDVSHRGGKAGFIDVHDDVLWVPDFQGNFYFNTLGNLVQHPRAGLVFFRDGALLQLSVDVEIIWDGSLVDRFVGAERLLKMRVREVVHLEDALALRFVDGPASPFSASTGSW